MSADCIKCAWLEEKCGNCKDAEIASLRRMLVVNPELAAKDAEIAALREALKESLPHLEAFATSFVPQELVDKVKKALEATK